MRVLFRNLLALLILCALSPSAPARQTPEQAIDSLMAAYDEAPDDAAKLALCRDVLEKYPESGYTVPLLEMARDHSDALGKMDTFITFAEGIRARVAGEEVRRSIDRFMLGTYGRVKQLDKLNALAGALTTGEEGDFNLYYDLMRAYTAAEQWQRVLSWADKARPFATAEAYRKDYPDRKMSDEELAGRARNREGLVFTYSGWAKSQTGSFDAALADFTAADAGTERLYTGHTYGELDYYWGRTLLAAGRLDEALERLAAKAVFGGDEETKTALHEAYVKKHGGEGGYDAFISQTRTRLARTIDDFTLKGYDGKDLSLSSFQGKVIVLSFWFPT